MATQSESKKSKKAKRSSHSIPPAPPPPPLQPNTATSVLEASSSSHKEAQEPSPRSESPVIPTKPAVAQKPKRLHKTLSARSFSTFWKQKSTKKDSKAEQKDGKGDEKKGKKEGKASGEKQRKKEVADEPEEDKDEPTEKKASVELRESPLWKLPGLSTFPRRHSSSSIEHIPQTMHSQSPRETSTIIEHPAEQTQESETPSKRETPPVPEPAPVSEAVMQPDSLPNIAEALDEPPELPPRPDSPFDFSSDETETETPAELPVPPEESENTEPVKPTEQTDGSEKLPEPKHSAEHSATLLASTEKPAALPPSDVDTPEVLATSDTSTSTALPQLESAPSVSPTNPETTSNSPSKSDSSGSSTAPTPPKMDPTLRPLPEIPAHLRPLPRTPPPPHAEFPKSENRPKPPKKPDNLVQLLQRPGTPTTIESSQETIDELPVREKKQPPVVTVEASETLAATTEARLPEILSVGELANKYSKKFPLRIKVLQGYSEETSELTISTDDVYDIHFIKHTKVVKIKDEDNYTYSLPLGSAMKFGFVYNPNNDFDEALSGLMFEKIADITAMSTLPKVICATQAYQTSDEKIVVEENEIIVVRHVHRSMFKGKKGLKVFSVLSKTEKVLPDDCAGHFSTKPSLVRMHLPEIIEYIQIPFPAQAVMYHGGDTTGPGQNKPATQSRVVTMYDSSTETSLVASLVAAGAGEEETDSGDQQLFDIPVDENSSGIEVRILRCSSAEDNDEEEPEHIYDDTINVLQNFDPTKLQLLNSAKFGSKANLQSLLLTNVREGYEREGIEVESPYVNITGKKASAQRRNSDSDEDDDPDNPYDTVGIKRQSSSHRDSTGYDRVGDRGESQGDPRLSCWLEDLQSSTHALDSRLRSLEYSHTSTEMSK